MDRTMFRPWFWVWSMAFVWAVVSLYPGGASAQDGSRIRDHLYAVYMLNADEAWAVGSFGALYHTKNHGQQWEKQDSKVIEPLYGVRFVDANEGWVAGKSGLILHTT